MAASHGAGAGATPTCGRQILRACHAKLNPDETCPELLQSRTAVPEVLQFYGMELTGFRGGCARPGAHTIGGFDQNDGHRGRALGLDAGRGTPLLDRRPA